MKNITVDFFEVGLQRLPYSIRKLDLIISHEMSEDLRLSEISNGCGSYICTVVQAKNKRGTCFMSTVDRKSTWNLRTSLQVVSLRYHCCVFLCSEKKMSANSHSIFFHILYYSLSLSLHCFKMRICHASSAFPSPFLVS